MLYPYNHYKLRWAEKYSDTFENTFSITRHQHWFKKVELASERIIDFYLDICTVKGCSDRKSPCRIVYKSTMGDDPRSEGNSIQHVHKVHSVVCTYTAGTPRCFNIHNMLP